MHRIEDILRQLNTVAAELQPEVAAHLLQIQKRLDTAHVSQRNAHTTSAAPPRSVLAASGAATVGGSAASALGASALGASALGGNPPSAPMVRMDAAGSSSWPLGWDSSSQEDAVAVAHQALGGPIIVSPAPVLEPRRAAAGEPPEPKIHEPAVPHFSLRLNQPLHQPLNQPAAPPVGPPSTDRPDRGSSRGAVAAPFHDDVARPVPREEGGSAATADLDDQVIAGTTAAADSQLDASPGLPLFESLWFRQCAPQSGTARIVDRLLQKLSPAVPAVLHFCQDRSSRAASHLVCTQVAWELSRRGQGPVLLVDADYAYREISRQLGNVYLPGLSEWLNLGEPIDALVRPTGVEHLDWLPSGSGDISFRQIAGGRWAEISLQLRRRFQWICVHAGAAQDRVTTTWGRFCDFSYLITSMEDTHGPSTKQMVDQLRRAECRLSGLITID